MENYIDICSEVTSKKLQRTKEKTIETNANYKEMHTIEECVQIVESMEDIDHNTFNKQMDKIVVFEWRRIFIAKNEERCLYLTSTFFLVFFLYLLFLFNNL